jgi:hypothetical protein
MQEIPGLSTATALILVGLDRAAVIRGLKIELDLTTDEAEAAWEAATDRLNGSTEPLES